MFLLLHSILQFFSHDPASFSCVGLRLAKLFTFKHALWRLARARAGQVVDVKSRTLVPCDIYSYDVVSPQTMSDGKVQLHTRYWRKPFFNLRLSCLPIKHVEVRCKLESCLALGDSTRKLLIPERWACAARAVHCLNICVTMAKYLSFETEYRAFLISALVACRICVKTYMRVFYEMYIFAFQM